MSRLYSIIYTVTAFWWFRISDFGKWEKKLKLNVSFRLLRRNAAYLHLLIYTCIRQQRKIRIYQFKKHRQIEISNSIKFLSNPSKIVWLKLFIFLFFGKFKSEIFSYCLCLSTWNVLFSWMIGFFLVILGGNHKPQLSLEISAFFCVLSQSNDTCRYTVKNSFPIENIDWIIERRGDRPSKGDKLGGLRYEVMALKLPNVNAVIYWFKIKVVVIFVESKFDCRKKMIRNFILFSFESTTDTNQTIFLYIKGYFGEIRHPMRWGGLVTVFVWQVK